MSERLSRLCSCALATALLVLPAAPRAHAQSEQSKVPVRAVTVDFAPLPVLTFSVRDFLDAGARKKLQSGLPQTLAMRVYAYAERENNPLAVSALSCRVVYDLWEGVYRIQRQTERSDKTLSVKGLDGVVQHCLDVQKLPLGDAASLVRVRGKRVYFGVLVEWNPLSQDTVQRIRRWLARPSGGPVEGNAFFGSFVSIFVSRQMGAAEKSFAFRSELHDVPP